MKFHTLLTPEAKSKKPDSIDILMDFGELTIIVNNDSNDLKSGLHCILEGEEEDFSDWINNLDEYIIGSGAPQMESFTIHKKQES